MLKFRFYRTKNKALFGGLLAALSERFGFNRNLLRLLYFVLSIATGFFPGLILYIALCIVIPSRESPDELVIKGLSESEFKIRQIVAKINKTSTDILTKKIDNPLLESLMREFKEKIIEFRNYTPRLEKRYLECSQFLKESDSSAIASSLAELKIKSIQANETLRYNYLKMIEQKEMRLKLIEEIKENKDLIESKLILIRETLQNIEAGILSVELKTQIEDQSANYIQTQISIFTESLSGMDKLFNSNKLRI